MKTDISAVLTVLSGQGSSSDYWYLIRDVRITGGVENASFGIDSGNGKWYNGKWYSFRLERSTFGLITWVNSKTWLSLLVIII
jgi:hypothetical protein